MTDEERKNRNPAVEAVRTTLEELEATHPVVTASELELHKVYIIQSIRHIVTLNYMGSGLAMHPITLDTMKIHHFHGPRAGLDVFIAACPDGSFTDASGTRLTVRKWMGDDQ